MELESWDTSLFFGIVNTRGSETIVYFTMFPITEMNSITIQIPGLYPR